MHVLRLQSRSPLSAAWSAASVATDSALPTSLNPLTYMQKPGAARDAR